MPEPLDPRDTAEILWHGRPEVGVRLPDLLAAFAAFLATLVVLGAGLAFQNQWDWAWALPLAAGYGGVVGVVMALGRASGAGRGVTLATAFCTALSAAALWTARSGLELLCPLTTTGVFFGFHGLRWWQHRSTRYQLTAERGRAGIHGRYVISFPLGEEPPSIRKDRFGASLGDVVFGEVEPTLSTREGRIFKMPPQERSFQRVLHPERLLEALRERDTDPPSAPA